MFTKDKFFLSSMIVFLLLFWLNTGTLAPYAVTLDEPQILEKGLYPVNIDHEEFAATFRFLRWESKGWQYSSMLRRIFYPVIAWPTQTIFGFMLGGLIAAFLLHLWAYRKVYEFFIHRHKNNTSKILFVLLLRTPGIFYWSGLPYSFVCIMTLGFLLFIECLKLEKEIPSDPKKLWKQSFWMGVLMTGYDLFPVFGPVAAGLFLWKKKWKQIPLLFAGLLTPQLAVLLLIKLRGQNIVNSNSVSYLNILKSYLNWPEDKGPWFELIAQVPYLFLHVFLYSNFFILPALFLILWCLNFFTIKIRFYKTEVLLLGIMCALFFFNQLAPPYPGWQLRGEWIPRVYQASIFTYLYFCSRFLAGLGAHFSNNLSKVFVRLVLGLVLILQISIVLGSYLGIPQWTQFFYHRFYKHGAENAYTKNIERWGVRPYGL